MTIFSTPHNLLFAAAIQQRARMKFSELVSAQTLQMCWFLRISATCIPHSLAHARQLTWSREAPDSIVNIVVTKIHYNRTSFIRRADDHD